MWYFGGSNAVWIALKGWKLRLKVNLCRQSSWRKCRQLTSLWRQWRIWRRRRKSGYGHTGDNYWLCQTTSVMSAFQPSASRRTSWKSACRAQRCSEAPRSLRSVEAFTLTGSQVQTPLCPTAVSLTKTDSPQADRDLWPGALAKGNFLSFSSICINNLTYSCLKCHFPAIKWVDCHKCIILLKDTVT